MKTKILIIDDEQMLLDNFKMIKWGDNLEMVFCNNAISAAELIPQADGIVSDVMMADVEYLDRALALVKKNVPVFRMTGNLNYEGENVLIKPFSIKQLKETVNNMMLKHQEEMLKQSELA